MSQRSATSSSIEDKQSSQSGSSQPVITDSSSSVPISSGYSTEGTGSSTQGGQSMEAPNDADPIVVEAGETVVYSVQRSVSSQSHSSESSTSSKTRKAQRPKKSASATSQSSQESEPSQPSQLSQASQESRYSRKQTSKQSSQVVEIPAEDAPREESEDDEIAMETNVEPSTSGKEVINKQSYVVTMNDPSELMPTSESQPEQPRTQTVIKKTKSQKKGKAKIDVKAVTGMEQEGSQEEETQEQETQEQGDAFTLELDEDPLGSSGLFMAEDTSETMETEASTSATPASTKRKGKPKKLSSAKTTTPVAKKKPGRPKQAKADVSGSKQKKPKAASTGKKKAGATKQKGSATPITPIGATSDEPTEEDTKRMPPKHRRVRRRITMPTSTSTPAGKVAVVECTTSGELPSVEPTATVEDEDWTMEFDEDSTMSKSSSRQSPMVRTPWEIAEKRMLVAEAKQWGIRPTARRHNMSFSTLRVWMAQDFGDLPGTKKRLPGGGRPLRYDQSIDVALKDWVLQKMAMKEKVTHEELREKAMEMIVPYNPDFQCSQGWITRFLYRHEINLKTKVIGKDAHPPKVKEFGTPSPSKTRKRGTPKSADKAASQETPVSAPLGKRKAATTPAGRRKRPRREAAEKSDLSIFDFED